MKEISAKIEDKITMCRALTNIIGLLLECVGVLILFFCGMPYAIRTGGGEFMVTHPSAAGIARERFYDRLGWLGLALLVIGTGLQIWTAWANRRRP
jgi:hypothetical protein